MRKNLRPFVTVTLRSFYTVPHFPNQKPSLKIKKIIGDCDGFS